MIKYKTEKIIECHDWDELVKKTYGRPYCFQQQDGCQDRGMHNITISKKEMKDYFEDNNLPTKVNDSRRGVSFETWLNRSVKEGVEDYFDKSKLTTDKSSIDLFWNRSFYPSLGVIANDMCRKGLIEPGDYIINIDW